MKDVGANSAASLILLWLAQITGIAFFFFGFEGLPTLIDFFPYLSPWEKSGLLFYQSHTIPFAALMAILTAIAIWFQKQHPMTLLNRIALVPNFLFFGLMAFVLLLSALHIDLLPTPG